MNRLTRFLLGFWMCTATMMLIILVEATFPEFASENNLYLGLFFVSSILTATGVWLND